MTPKEMLDAADMLDKFIVVRGHLFSDQRFLNLSTSLREHADEMEPGTVPHSPAPPPIPPEKVRPDKWCECQMIATDIPNGWACGAHLNEGRCFECRYTVADLYEFPSGKMKPAGDGAKYQGVCEDYEPPKPEPVPPPELTMPNIWDRCTALAVANGAAAHDHGHGDVAALVLKKLQQHLHDHEIYGVDHPYFEILCRRRKKTVEDLLKKKDKDQPETDKQAADRLEGQSVTVFSRAYDDDVLRIPVGFPRISMSIRREYGVQITSVQIHGGALKELGVFDVIVHVGNYKATVNVCIVKKEED